MFTGNPLTRNERAVMALRATHKISDLFIDIFLTFYLWDLSGSSVPVLCQYRVCFSLATLAAMMSVVRFSRSRHRKWFLVAGLFGQLAQLFLLFLLGQSCLRYVGLLGAMSGFFTGLYYVVYNQYEVQGVMQEGRARFFGWYESLSCVIKVLFPVASGFVIDRYGMSAGILCIMASTAFSLVCAFLYVDDVPDAGQKVSFNGAYVYLHGQGALAKSGFRCFLLADLFGGMTMSYGAFDVFLSVCVMGLFPTVVALGWVNGIANAFAILFGLLFGRLSRRLPGLSPKILLFLRILGMLLLPLALYSGHGWLLVSFLLSYKAASSVDTCLYSTATGSFAQRFCGPYVTEVFVTMEVVLTVARLIGYGVLYVYGRCTGSYGSVPVLVAGFYVLVLALRSRVLSRFMNHMVVSDASPAAGVG